MKLADPAYVAEQYRDSTRFDARVQIYALYDTSPEPWMRWLFGQLALREGERVLELGCGTANVWRENAERVPAGVALVLTDLSPGMLSEARARLTDLPLSPELREADAQALSFADESFDLVIANHMLYHVPDRARALGEVRRVLRSGGRFVAGTNHWTHLLELRELLTRFALAGLLLAPARDRSEFDLETAAEEIASVLDVVGVERRQSSLEIRDVEPLIAYVRSMADSARVPDTALEPLARHVARQIELMGALHVGIASGVVRARRAPAPAATGSPGPRRTAQRRAARRGRVRARRRRRRTGPIRRTRGCPRAGSTSSRSRPCSSSARPGRPGSPRR